MRKNKFIVFLATTLGIMGLGLSSSASAAYNPLDPACSGSGANSSVCQQATNQGDKNPLIGSDGIITKVVSVVGVIVGVVSIVMIIFGGFSYITSAGNPEKVATAKRRIIYALIGLAVAALAWAIVGFVTDRIL